MTTRRLSYVGLWSSKSLVATGLVLAHQPEALLYPKFRVRTSTFPTSRKEDDPGVLCRSARSTLEHSHRFPGSCANAMVLSRLPARSTDPSTSLPQTNILGVLRDPKEARPASPMRSWALPPRRVFPRYCEVICRASMPVYEHRTGESSNDR